jgi:hypothetical protein
LRDIIFKLIIIDNQHEDFVRGIHLVIVYLSPVSGNEEMVDMIIVVELGFPVSVSIYPLFFNWYPWEVLHLFSSTLEVVLPRFISKANGGSLFF